MQDLLQAAEAAKMDDMAKASRETIRSYGCQ
jgi:hypothetical protein